MDYAQQWKDQGYLVVPQVIDLKRMKQLRGYVATYQPWFLLPGYLDACTPDARIYYEKFIETYRDTWKPEYLAELTPPLQDYFTKLVPV